MSSNFRYFFDSFSLILTKLGTRYLQPRQPCEIFMPKFLDLYGRDAATILKLKKNYFSFVQSYGYINILCHIFNSARNNQQQLVIFIYVMVSAGVCFDWKERLHFFPDKTKVNAKLYVETLLPEQIQECRSVLPSGFIFQQDGVPAHMTKLAKTGLLPTAVNSLVKMNGLQTRLTCHVCGAMLERYNSFQPKPENIDELRKVLQSIWDQLPQHSIKKVILSSP